MNEPILLSLSLETRHLGRPTYFIKETDSTNRLLREMADGGAAAGTVLIADFQSAGRGRQTRSWQAPPGSSLLVSVLLQLDATLNERLSQFPLIIGVAVATTLEHHLNLSPTLKWPNDIQLDGKKVGGILIEASSSQAQTSLVVGIGLNVNQRAEDLATLPEATSLAVATGADVPREPLLARLLLELESLYEAWRDGWKPHEAWRQRAPMLGKQLWVYSTADDAYEATALDIDADGSLLIQRHDGALDSVRAADVSVRTPSP